MQGKGAARRNAARQGHCIAQLRFAKALHHTTQHSNGVALLHNARRSKGKA